MHGMHTMFLFGQLRKLGVLLDMNEGLDTLLDLAVDTEVLRDSFADVDLSSPDDEERERESLQGSEASTQSASGDSGVAHRAGGGAGTSARALVVADVAPPMKVMSTLRNTSWDKEAGNDDATEVRGGMKAGLAIQYLYMMCVCVCVFLFCFFVNETVKMVSTNYQPIRMSQTATGTSEDYCNEYLYVSPCARYYMVHTPEVCILFCRMYSNQLYLPV